MPKTNGLKQRSKKEQLADVSEAVASFMQLATNGKLDIRSKKLKEWKIFSLLNHRTNTGEKTFYCLNEVIHLNLDAVTFKICAVEPRCTNAQCPDLHVCKALFNGSTCSYGAWCLYTHSFNCVKNKLFLENFPLERCTYEDLKKILQWKDDSRYPKSLQLCQDYQQNCCKYQITGNCVGLHFCDKTLRDDKCTDSSSSCKLRHNILHKDCLRLLKFYEFNIDQTSAKIKDDLRKYLKIKPPKTEKEEFKTATKTPSACENGENWYAWKYDSQGVWKYFDTKISRFLEEAYCCPNPQDDVTINMEDWQGKVDFITMTATISSSHQKINIIEGKIRRIFTDSTPYNFLNTHYIWCFVNEYNTYEEFGSRSKDSFKSNRLEREYLKYLISYRSNREFKYTIGKFSYVLDFETMTQENQETKVKRRVIRRPLQPLERVTPGNWICRDNMQSKCKYGEKCTNRHIKEHYAWDIKGPDGNWYKCPGPAAQIEQAYIGPYPKVFWEVPSPESATLDFINMTYKSLNRIQITLELRRVSVEPQFPVKHNWYVRDGTELQKVEILLQNNNIEDWIIDSIYLEHAFNHYKNTASSNNTPGFVTHKINQLKYILHFPSMTLKCATTRKMNMLIRRAAPVENTAVETPTPTTTPNPSLCLYNCAKPDGGLCTCVPCPNLHKRFHYLWQYRKLNSGKSWKDFHDGNLEAQEILEKRFCDPNNLQTTVNLKPARKEVTLMFNTMQASTATLSQKKTLYEFRRLATPDAKRNTPERFIPFTNIYRWYWYKESTKKMQAVDFQKQINSRKLEHILNNKQEIFELKKNKKVVYILENINSLGAIITNTTNFCRRPVHRRPNFIPATVLEKRRDKMNFQTFGSEEIYFPIEWRSDLLNVKSQNGFHKVIVESNSEEYKMVENLFKATSNSTIIAISRVQNKFLWQAYCLRKRCMEKVLGKGSAREMKLFHGTSSSCVDPICEQGFDHRLYGTASGSAYGQGSYFSTTARYSHRYSKGGSMILANVLVGDYCLGDGHMRRPAPKHPSQPNGLLYDSTVNNVTDPEIFVTFYSDQAYPAYIINFK